MPSADETALIRCACMKAELTIEQVVGTLSLLAEEIGETRDPADTDTRSRWATIAVWLSDRLRIESANIAGSLQHDELVAARIQT